MELPLWFRETAAVSAVALLAAGVMFWIVLRYFARFRARALALVLERRFPELGTRLITAVEMAAARSGNESPLTSAMIERTIDEAARMSSTLPLESVFDRAPLRRALVAAALLVGSIAGLSPGRLVGHVPLGPRLCRPRRDLLAARNPARRESRRAAGRPRSRVSRRTS